MTDQAGEFVTYREFGDKDMTRLMTDILDEHNIPYLVEDNSDQLDSTIMGSPHKGLLVKLESENFETVNKLLEALADEELETVDKDYFMFQFSDEELKDVLVKASEWSHLDVALAQKLLRDRGVDFSKETILEMRKAELEASQKTEQVSNYWFVAGYVFLLFAALVSMIMGAVYLFSHKIDLAGNKVNSYDDASRKHGRILFILGALFFIVKMFLLTTKNYDQFIGV